MHTTQNMLEGSTLAHGDAHRASHARWTRRSFLNSLGLAAGGALMIGNTPVQALQPTSLLAHLHQEQTDRILVLVQLFGGNDGLNTLVQFDNDEYYRLRPGLSIPKPDVLPFSQDQGFHPSFSSLLPMYQEGQMGIIQGVGYPDPNLSHFRSTDIWLTSSESKEYLKSGWIGRSMETILDQMGQTPYPLAVQLGSASPLLFKGEQRGIGMTINNLEQFNRLAGSGKLYDDEAVPGLPAWQRACFRPVNNE